MKHYRFFYRLLFLAAASIALSTQAGRLSFSYTLSQPATNISPFSNISIQTDHTHDVTMRYDGLKVRSTTAKDLSYYEEYFSQTPVMSANYFADGMARDKARIDSAFALWDGRWAKSPFTQEHFQGGFLVYFQDNENPFAHLVDGFISNDYLKEILEDGVDDFEDHKGLLGEFKSTISRLIGDNNSQGYSQASLDFTGANVGFFVKDEKRLQQLTLLQDTYMHQLSYLGYNWGLENLLGRTVAQASKPVLAVNFIKAYEAMGYYPFKMKEKVKFGVDKEEVEFVHFLKPVNPVQATFRFKNTRENIEIDIHLMSYFSTSKTFKLQVLHEDENGEEKVLYNHVYDLAATAPFSLLLDVDKKYAKQLLWLKLVDADGILEPYLMPLRVNSTD